MQLKHLLIAAGLCSAMPAAASSHRESPFLLKQPMVDATDFYLFSSYEPDRQDYVTMIANYLPVQAAYGGPNYFPLDETALYEIHIDNDGDVVEDFTFQFSFQNNLPAGGVATIPVGDQNTTAVLRNLGTIDPDTAIESGLNHSQSYSVTLVEGERRGANRTVLAENLRKPFDYSGTKTFTGPGNYETYARQFIHEVAVPSCDHDARIFVGQRHEAFNLALGEVFDLVNFVPIEGDSAPMAGDGAGFPGGVTQDRNRNQLAGLNVTSIAVEIHKDCISNGSDIVGAWTTASLPQASIVNPNPTFEQPAVTGGAWTQVSRLSAPLVNELVIGYDQKNAFNASHPQNDTQFLNFVTHPALPEILNSLFLAPVNSTLGATLPTLAPTNLPRNDLVAAFLTGFSGVNQFTDGTPGEMLRLNTAIAPTARETQHPLGVAAGDLAGFPNGRRPGDDTVDIALRVVMGALCHDLPLGENGAGVNLGFCSPSDANVGNVPFTDGAPLSAAELNNSFPYLLTPYPGSPVGSPLPTPID